MNFHFKHFLYYRKLGLELVPRRGAEAVDPEDMSLVELYRVHVESAERAAAVSQQLQVSSSSYKPLDVHC